MDNILNLPSDNIVFLSSAPILYCICHLPSIKPVTFTFYRFPCRSASRHFNIKHDTRVYILLSTLYFYSCQKLHHLTSYVLLLNTSAAKLISPMSYCSDTHLIFEFYHKLFFNVSIFVWGFVLNYKSNVVVDANQISSINHNFIKIGINCPYLSRVSC